MRLSLLFYLLASILLSSCALVRDGVHPIENRAIPDSYSNFNGNYSNTTSVFKYKDFRGKADLNASSSYLWRVFREFKGEYDPEKWDACSVNIEFVNKHKARVCLVFQDSIIDSKYFRGKFKDGYFYKRPLFLALPLFPLAFSYVTKSYRFGLNNNQDLIIEKSWNSWGFVFISATNHRWQSFASYKKEND